MHYRNLIAILMLIGLVVSCTPKDFKVNEVGLHYKFIEHNKNAPAPKTGDVVTLKTRFTDAKGTTLEESAVFRIQLNKASHLGGSIEDAIALMHKGDSAIFKINAALYYGQTRRIAVPEGIAPDDYLLFYIRLLDITPFDTFVSERNTAKLSKEREEEQLLNDYLKRANIQVEPTMSGLYIIELKKGTGIAPTPGKKVSMHYMGYFVDGKIFDSSYDRNQPFEFVYGTGEVIQGWDEAIGNMAIGGKYKVIIPSYLAYGDRQRGPIPPNSTLIFEMELLDVAK